MKKTLWMIACILFITATLSACSSDEFSTGIYNHNDFVVEFRDDGTFSETLWRMDGDQVVSEGTYSIQGDEFTWITDSYCDEEFQGPATYKWQYEDGRLGFELIGEDRCEDRSRLLSVYWFGPK